MSANMRGLLCEGVMIWVPLDLSHCELSNECQYEGSIGSITQMLNRMCLQEVYASVFPKSCQTQNVMNSLGR